MTDDQAKFVQALDDFPTHPAAAAEVARLRDVIARNRGLFMALREELIAARARVAALRALVDELRQKPAPLRQLGHLASNPLDFIFGPERK